jgi:haloalkane dehalogenase
VIETRTAGAISYRYAAPEGPPAAPPALCLHGFPETSRMWTATLEAIAAAGHRAYAPDLPGYGASAPLAHNGWEELTEAIEGFVAEIGVGPVALVVHDWGGLIGLRWACDRPDRIAALVISDTGFFPDGRWHGMAEVLRTPGQGEEALGMLSEEGLGQVLAAASPTGYDEDDIAEYWRAFSTEEGRRAILEMYRSGDFEKLEPYDGRLGGLGVPTLLLWGENDEFAPIGGAHRLRKQIPGARLEVVEGAGHFVYADAPERAATAVAEFVSGL